MKYEITLDGGGSKLQTILFDEEYRCVATARSGNINMNFASAETIEKNVDDCFKHLFKDVSPDQIECVYGAFVGDTQKALQQLSALVPVRESDIVGEARLGLLAAGEPSDGILALSGTGSDIFLVQNKEEADVVGGWGALISDEGSGYYIGRMAVNAAIRDVDGRGPHTLLTELIQKEMGRTRLKDAVFAVYATGAAVTQIAKFVRLVSLAVQQGDEVACSILEENARAMAEQTAVMIRRHPEAAQLPIFVAGGAWKTRSYVDRYRTHIKQLLPNMEVRLPLFEPVMGGVIASICRRDGRLSSQMLALLRENFPQFCYKQD